MSDRPLIAVAWPKDEYVAALERAGAEVRVLDPVRDVLPDALVPCEGVLLTGGVDVDPRHYGETKQYDSVEVNATRDAYEMALVAAARARDLPLLAICRGVQVLNVAEGGSLFQDIPSDLPAALRHKGTPPQKETTHPATIRRDTCLGRLLAARLDASGELAINSRHHQALKTIAPGFVVSAIAPDGVVEGIERPEARFCVGVQWHPETYWRTGEFAALFKGLVSAARQGT